MKTGAQPSPVRTDGFALGRAPLAPPYAVVLISCSGLLAFIVLLLTCLCCKRGDVGFKVRRTREFRAGRDTLARPFLRFSPPPQPGEPGSESESPSGLKLQQNPTPDEDWTGIGGQLAERWDTD